MAVWDIPSRSMNDKRDDRMARHAMLVLSFHCHNYCGVRGSDRPEAKRDGSLPAIYGDSPKEKLSTGSLRKLSCGNL